MHVPSQPLMRSPLSRFLTPTTPRRAVGFFRFGGSPGRPFEPITQPTSDWPNSRFANPFDRRQLRSYHHGQKCQRRISVHTANFSTIFRTVPKPLQLLQLRERPQHSSPFFHSIPHSSRYHKNTCPQPSHNKTPLLTKLLTKSFLGFILSTAPQ